MCLILKACIIGNAVGWGSEFVLFGMQFNKWSAVSNPAAIYPVYVTAIIYGVVTPIASIRVATPMKFQNTGPGPVKVNRTSPIHYSAYSDISIFGQL